MQPYPDPYGRGQYQDQAYASQPSFTQSHGDDPDRYNDGSNPYNDDHRYSTYPTEPSGGNYQANPSTEKIVDDGAYGQSTERAQPGRSGLRPPPRSFAEMGPPPRSTGILRMWRKDERGQQWFRVGQLLEAVTDCEGWRFPVMFTDLL